MNLAEKYRPKALTDVVGQGRAVNTLTRLADGGIGGRALWIAGLSGTGKTTLAMLAASIIADPFCTEEYDGGELTTATVRELQRRLAVKGLGKGGRCVIVNEAHGMRKDVIRSLLTALEPIPAHVLWVFTTTLQGETLFEDCLDGSPLISRCVPIALEHKNLAAPFAERAKAIAAAEGLDGQPIGVYVKLAIDCKLNLRMMLAKIESGCFL